ncbi:MAG: Flp pilus assembly protein CpaB [Terriglobia bacterium]|nr:MAG: Flp pilus assembly protein CpaB [Terriglobia bacterium]
MNKRFLAVLLFAFVVASGASLMLYRLMSNRTPASKAAPASVKLALAARDLELGAVLREEDVTLTDWPGPMPAGSLLRVQDAVGRGVVAKMVAKEPILESRLAPKGAGGGFAATIPKGMRAVAVPVNEVVGVAGFVVPGMHVDILISGAPPVGTGNLGTLTKTLLQNIEVLSAGQDYKKDAEGKPVAVQVVNLLVTPEQAEQLSLASHQTTIQLVLRNPLDRDTAKTPGAAMAGLFTGARPNIPDGIRSLGDQAPKPRPRPVVQPVVQQLPPPPRKESPFVMEIITGTKKAETKFDGSGEGK